MPLHLIRSICLVGLPILLLAAAFCHFVVEGLFWSKAAYIISLTANIGYFTNFIAIKMLFKPHYPSAFGRQGLIPKNQPKLAAALSATLSDHFLASEHWQEYIQEADILKKILANSESFCHQWLSQQENQQQLTALIGRILQANQQPLRQLFEKIQTDLIQQLGQQIDPQQLLNKSFNWIETQFVDHPEEMEFLIEPIIKTVAENIPLIARRLNDTLDTHIENQDTFRRGIAKAAKWSANFSEDDIKHYLFRMVASFEFRQTLFEGLRSLLKEYKDRHNQLDSLRPATDFRALFNHFLSQQCASLNIAEYLEKQLQQPEATRHLEEILHSAITPIFNWLEATLQDPAVNQTLNNQLINLIEQIDLREIIKEKAAQFSPQKMESIFHNMIRDQLVFIELLGALLGGLSGLALVNLTHFLVLASLLSGYYGLDSLFTHFNRRQQQS